MAKEPVYKYRKVIIGESEILDVATSGPLSCPWGGDCVPECVAIRVAGGKAICVAGPKAMIIGIVVKGTAVGEVIESDEDEES